MVAYEAREGRIISLLFDRSYGWTDKRAESWAKKHDFPEMTFITHSPRFIHLGPTRLPRKIGSRMRTVHFGDGIEARIRFTGPRRRV